ncbi:MAG: hypothetical protein C0482_14410 [Gordonia sp.]|uniref:hypothetical protein n=1 Tax=Williamsia sp. 1138 TaxID=1903117 RepID=UPI000A0F5BFE|nr:hypothetical protein [Williamsia sp. 1138]MBA4023550.1 hypothetical protein [Gordonia sp. (in: high G+C Gram-positive bacteria)]OZG29441.1 hypothetical protein BH683_009755 [Williamsia sp. 1138]
MIDPRFVLIGAALSMVGSSWYAVLTVRGVVRPNRVSWFLWAAAPAIAFGAQVGDGVGLPAVTTLAVGLGPFVIFCASFANPSSYWRVSRFDLWCGVGAAVALLLWLVLDDPVLAVLTAVAADAIGGIPTVIKAWRRPDTERGFVYLFGTANGTLALLSLSAFDVAAVAFPLYLLLLGLTMCSIVSLRGRRFHAAADHSPDPSPTKRTCNAHPSSRPTRPHRPTRPLPHHGAPDRSVRARAENRR